MTGAGIYKIFILSRLLLVVTTALPLLEELTHDRSGLEGSYCPCVGGVKVVICRGTKRHTDDFYISVLQGGDCYYDSMRKCRRPVKNDFINSRMAREDLDIWGLGDGRQNTTNREKANSLWKKFTKFAHQSSRSREYQRMQLGYFLDHMHSQITIRILK